MSGVDYFAVRWLQYEDDYGNQDDLYYSQPRSYYYRPQSRDDGYDDHSYHDYHGDYGGHSYDDHKTNYYYKDVVTIVKNEKKKCPCKHCKKKTDKDLLLALAALAAAAFFLNDLIMMMARRKRSISGSKFTLAYSKTTLINVYFSGKSRDDEKKVIK